MIREKMISSVRRALDLGLLDLLKQTRTSNSRSQSGL